MTALGRWSGIGAALAGVVVLATWSWGGGSTRANASLDGRDLFAAKGCATCHVGPDSDASFGGFPSLRAASGWAGDRRPAMTPAAYLAESIAAPDAFRSPAFHGAVGPTAEMPRLRVTTEEIDALVGYLLDG